MTASASPAGSLAGRWQVRFNLSGTGEKHLIFEAQANGSASFLLLDAEPENKPMSAPVAAVWSETTNDRVSFTGEAEMPVGTCCREMGTLIFKGKFDSADAITGKLIFVGCTIDEENFNGFRSMVGSFAATRALK